MRRSKNMNLFKRIVLVLLILVLACNIAIQLLLTISGAGISVLDIYAQSLPKNDTIEIEYSDSYFVEAKTYFEKQEKGQCAGFASAYVLRTLGEEISGSESYERLGHKFANGYVMPQALLDLFREYDCNMEMLRGDLEQLKTRLQQGEPIIVLIGHFVSWQHYVTVLGYDEDHIYLYDSNMDIDNSKGYNRIMTNTGFVSQWENEIPLFEQIYFVVL